MKRTFESAFIALFTGLVVMPLIACEEDNDDIDNGGSKKEQEGNPQIELQPK